MTDLFAAEVEDDSKYIIIALKGARVHRSAIITDNAHVAFDFKSTVEARVVLDPTDGGRDHGWSRGCHPT